jgi:hypothetical protein
MFVRLAAAHDMSGIFRLTPGGTGLWGNIQFSIDSEVREADYVVVLNFCREMQEFDVPRGNLWLLLQEPPVGHRKYLHRGDGPYDLVFTSDPDLHGPRYLQSHSCATIGLPDCYDDLVAAAPLPKTRGLSWVTSSREDLPGHKLRMRFLERLRAEVDLDLYGHGFRYIEDKGEGLRPYRYSLAFENHSGPYYWSEKITDCLLAWTVPIYYGCSRILDYFPAKSLIRIDPGDPKTPRQIQSILENDDYDSRLAAIAEARELFLNRYQIFPFLAAHIVAQESRAGVVPRVRRAVRLGPPKPPLPLMLQRRWAAARGSIGRQLLPSSRSPRP